MVLDDSLLNTQYYKYESRVRGAIKGKELRPSLHLGVVDIENKASRSPSATVGHLTYIYIYVCVCVCVRERERKRERGEERERGSVCMCVCR